MSYVLLSILLLVLFWFINILSQLNKVVIDEEKKYFKLLELLGIYQEKGSVIVFVDKQENADDLVKNLVKNSYKAMALHGGVDQCDRESIIGFFKSANMALLVATSIAARGLDVKDLILVVNYDFPNHYEDYVHRCGYRFTIYFLSFILASKLYFIIS